MDAAGVATVACIVYLLGPIWLQLIGERRVSLLDLAAAGEAA